MARRRNPDDLAAWWQVVVDEAARWGRDNHHRYAGAWADPDNLVAEDLPDVAERTLDALARRDLHGRADENWPVFQKIVGKLMHIFGDDPRAQVEITDPAHMVAASVRAR